MQDGVRRPASKRALHGGDEQFVGRDPGIMRASAGVDLAPSARRIFAGFSQSHEHGLGLLHLVSGQNRLETLREDVAEIVPVIDGAPEDSSVEVDARP